MNVVAHQDDDLLFLSPDLLHDIRAGRCVRTVFVTAGDAAERVGGTADQRRRYWLAREAGSRAAYAQLSRVPNSWTESHMVVSGHRIVMFTLNGNPRISQVNLRLPDGNPDGSGTRFHGHESLLKLRAGQIRVIHAIDGSAFYTKVGLLATISTLIRDFRPELIRTQDYVAPDFATVFDHADHTATAELAHAASDAYSAPHELIGYVDYQVSLRPSDLSGSDLAAKQAAFYRYDRYDSQLPCYTPALRAKNSECASYVTWLSREYRVSTGPGWNELCLVPEVTGGPAFGYQPASEGSAEAQIRAQGCTVGTVSHSKDSSVPKDYVISQKPEQSPVFLPQGTKVSIEVSNGR